MAHDIRIPRLGWSMEEGTFVRWLKQPGERVAQGEPLFELEGEKAVEPVESIDGGILHVPAGAPAAGTVLKVGHLVGWLLAEGESPPAAVAEAAPPRPSAPTRVPPDAPAPSQPVAPPAGPCGGPASPTIRRLARELLVDLSTVAGTGTGGRIVADDVFAVAVARGGGIRDLPPGRRRPSTPRARATAARLGVDWRALAGSGRGGRVRELDVLGAERPPVPAAAPLPARLAGLPARRRTISQRMLASQRDNAPVTLHTRADVTALVALRARLKAAGAGPVPAYTDLLAKLVAPLLLRHPPLAGCWTPASALAFPDAAGLHIGIAVDTDAGLLVPVVRDVGRRPLAEVIATSRELIEKARAGRLTTAEMEGGVFTLTNLGSFGIDEFTPVIHDSQTAILGLGAIRRVPVVGEGAGGGADIVIRDQITLSLTFDHCRVDGAPAARFLDELCRAIAAGTIEA
jgi:pyruvate dehydrogenase E2 component (dihydrolipoamide acetyltransferase)